ncbi:hypothetical protein H5410_009581 [Solanum commersonii]|uniref:Uncharacterized protein n=1 Tax=Solanum commersonii TaxID=4109 RepID=A0A9J6AJ62_SOLCO|nr:hypothetical protein H5410_009581 [Solanum commersonii]
MIIQIPHHAPISQKQPLPFFLHSHILRPSLFFSKQPVRTRQYGATPLPPSSPLFLFSSLRFSGNNNNITAAAASRSEQWRKQPAASRSKQWREQPAAGAGPFPSVLHFFLAAAPRSEQSKPPPGRPALRQLQPAIPGKKLRRGAISSSGQQLRQLRVTPVKSVSDGSIQIRTVMILYAIK